ncbi:YgcG family protein [Caulobacter sp. 17J65-9]|uniref:TPM domain-containing protein n=1 Tax=Caulobacter sp. 17J65-9 TaxID=2709382 RepID=UPI0013C8CE82|nr:YgcG family protein [Caulobacter sp. 17J65-9]NEX94923.1 YgcG family protein [Caulobacter sp. 17J65-9]
MILSNLASAVRTTALAFVAVLAFASGAQAEPKFPPLTGRVVDQANILPPETEAALDQKLAALEQATTDQMVVVTVPSLQDYEIEDYGYQLGRHWQIGQKGADNGVLLIVAPNERKVRLEVGYGLEPVLTDALSSVIIQQKILPRFRDGDYPGGVVAGTDAVIQQLTLDPAEAQARAKEAAEEMKAKPARIEPEAIIFIAFVAFLILSSVFRALGFGRRRPGRDSGLLPIILWSLLSSGGGRGGGGGGGGGFSGGGGSFGGGGASGGW